MSDTKKILYISIDLTEESKKLLRETLYFIHPKTHGDHLTIIFKPTPTQVAKVAPDLGTKVKLMAYAHVFDAKGQAVLTQSVNRLDKGVDHITLSCAEGVAPKYSNELIDKGPVMYLDAPFFLEGVWTVHS